MPKRVRVLSFKLKAKYPKRLRKHITDAYYKAFSEWIYSIYPQVISETPVYQGENPSVTKGLIRRSLKIIRTSAGREHRYKTIGIPGGTMKGTPPYHALMALLSLHSGRRPITIKGKVMTFPLKSLNFRNPRVARPPPGGRGPKTWVVTRKVKQRAREGTNPWIYRIVSRRYREILKFLDKDIKAKKKIIMRREKGEIKIVAG